MVISSHFAQMSDSHHHHGHHLGSGLWHTLKKISIIRKDHDSGKDHESGKESHPTSPQGTESAELLSQSQVETLPALQNGNLSAQSSFKEEQANQSRRSLSWLRSLSSRKNSLDQPSATAHVNSVAIPNSPAGQPHTNHLARDHSTEVEGARASRLQRSNSASHENGQVPLESKAQPGTREAFLEAFDAASLEISNRLSGGKATCMGDTGFQEVAPWNRAPGYLVLLTAWSKFFSPLPRSKQGLPMQHSPGHKTLLSYIWWFVCLAGS